MLITIIAILNPSGILNLGQVATAVIAKTTANI